MGGHVLYPYPYIISVPMNAWSGLGKERQLGLCSEGLIWPLSLHSDLS